MNANTSERMYRIDSIRAWASESKDEAPQAIRTFFEGKEVSIADLEALSASFGANVESTVQGAARFQAVVEWNGHRYDLNLEPVS